MLVTLHRTFGIPLDVVAESRGWHALRRQPDIAEHDATRGRVLVRFSAIGPFGSSGGTCLYAPRDGEWGCYVIKPSAAASLATGRGLAQQAIVARVVSLCRLEMLSGSGFPRC